MYRVELTQEKREELKRRTRELGLKRRTRDRLEMVRLSDAGWSVPRIAQVLEVSEGRVRHFIKAFLVGGFDALPDRPHPGRQSTITVEAMASVKEEIRKGDRTWTASHLADWIKEKHGIDRSVRQWSRRLKAERIVFKRTNRGLGHKQNLEEVEAKKTELEGIEKRGMRA